MEYSEDLWFTFLAESIA